MSGGDIRAMNRKFYCWNIKEEASVLWKYSTVVLSSEKQLASLKEITYKGNVDNVNVFNKQQYFTHIAIYYFCCQKSSSLFCVVDNFVFALV